MTIERGDIIGVILGKIWEIRDQRTQPGIGWGRIYGLNIKMLTSALVLITGIVWALVLYLRYFIRRKKLLKKMNEIRRGPSHTLAMMGLSIIMPFAPGKLLLDGLLWAREIVLWIVYHIIDMVKIIERAKIFHGPYRIALFRWSWESFLRSHCVLWSLLTPSSSYCSCSQYFFALIF